jgi:uncharacterized membrane protein
MTVLAFYMTRIRSTALHWPLFRRQLAVVFWFGWFDKTLPQNLNEKLKLDSHCNVVWLKMADGLLQVVGFVLLVLGLILLLRAYGLVNRESLFVKYHKLIGYPLLISGAIVLIISFFSPAMA